MLTFPGVCEVILNRNHLPWPTTTLTEDCAAVCKYLPKFTKGAKGGGSPVGRIQVFRGGLTVISVALGVANLR